MGSGQRHLRRASGVLLRRLASGRFAGTTTVMHSAVDAGTPIVLAWAPPAAARRLPPIDAAPAILAPAPLFPWTLVSHRRLHTQARSFPAPPQCPTPAVEEKRSRTTSSSESLPVAAAPPRPCRPTVAKGRSRPPLGRAAGVRPAARRATRPNRTVAGGYTRIRAGERNDADGRRPAAPSYSTVTDLARFLGWSTSQPRRTATSYAKSCSGTAVAIGSSGQGRWGSGTTARASSARRASEASPNA